MTGRSIAATAARDASEWVAPMARAGYAARGVIYLLIGGLALLSALGRGGSTEGSQGALEKLMGSPGGWVLLLLVGVGLVGFAVWRFVQGAFDPDRRGTDAKAWAIRLGRIFSALIHLALAFWAITRSIGYASQGSSDAETSQSWTAWLLGQPFGRWLVAGVGAVILGIAIAQVIKGWKAKFRKHLDTSDDIVDRLTPICRFGLMARGAAFGIIAGFFFYAAWTYDAQQAGGLKQAFDAIRSVAFGQILLATMALGLIAYAIFSFIEARYRRI